MRRTFLVMLAFLVVCCGAALGDEKPLRVFFVGNSYTYVNDLPGVLAGLAEAGRGRTIVTGQYTPGGYTLEQHVKDGKAVEGIKKQKWDVVVLQEQSTLPLSEPARMYNAARKLQETINGQEAQTLFYLTWARKGQPQTQNGLTQIYVGIAEALHARVAPVGTAWQRAAKEDPAPELYAQDGSHPSPAGTYLAACVFYATLLNKSPLGLPAEVKKGRQTLLTIDPALATRLQKVAWKTVQDSKPATPSQTQGKP